MVEKHDYEEALAKLMGVKVVTDRINSASITETLDLLIRKVEGELKEGELKELVYQEYKAAGKTAHDIQT